MCTLILAWQVFENAPIVVVANRDEALDRPSEPPAVREWDARVVAPRDREAEGTWIGYNEHGVFAGITNGWLSEPIDGDRSRGLLVRDVLGRETAEEAVRFVERAVADAAYDAFNLVLADDAAALYVEWDGQLRVRNLEPGVHVAVNVGIDGQYSIPSHRTDAGEAQASNADRVWDAVHPSPGEGVDAWIDRTVAVVRDHDYGVCVHREGTDPGTGEAYAFGTRSSSLIVLGATGPTYRFADGPPCRTEYRPVEGQV